VFGFSRLGEKIYSINQNFFNFNIPELSFSLKDYGINFNQVLSILYKTKSSYLDYLCKIQGKKFDIICIPEPIYSNDEFIKYEISFLFISENRRRILAFWESVVMGKATYVFSLNRSVSDDNLVLKNIEEFLMLKVPKKRTILRSNPRGLIEGVNSITGVRHDYEVKVDYSWINNIKTILKAR